MDKATDKALKFYMTYLVVGKKLCKLGKTNSEERRDKKMFDVHIEDSFLPDEFEYLKSLNKGLIDAVESAVHKALKPYRYYKTKPKGAVGDGWTEIYPVEVLPIIKRLLKAISNALSSVMDVDCQHIDNQHILHEQMLKVTTDFSKPKSKTKLVTELTGSFMKLVREAGKENNKVLIKNYKTNEEYWTVSLNGLIDLINAEKQWHRFDIEEVILSGLECGARHGNRNQHWGLSFRFID